mgnify:CR=1 FL=1
MLDNQTIEIVKSTAPLLQENGEMITQHFYKRMFSHNPEVKQFFNTSNQASGMQQKALAAAVVSYAENIDNLENLGEAIELIAQKHASLQIKPEHYPIVGENLLMTLKEVLGDTASDQVIDAWNKAYNALATILQNREAAIYKDNAQKTGGWEGFRQFQIVSKQEESSIITSLYLQPEDGKPLPDFLPGQYITLRVCLEDGHATMRNYSLSDIPSKPYFRISVKREDGAVAAMPAGRVSNLVHKSFNIGNTVEIAPPCGQFVLKDIDLSNKPIVFIAGGIGITPLISMLLDLTARKLHRQLVFIHCCINSDVQAFKNTLLELEKNNSNLSVYFRYSQPDAQDLKAGNNCSEGLISADFIRDVVKLIDAEYYFCGPGGFMKNIYSELTSNDVPKSQLHFEFFGPKQAITG